MYCQRQNKISQSIITVTAVGRYTPGDKLQEQVAGTRRNTSQHVTATNPFLIREFLRKQMCLCKRILLQQHVAKK